jgi:hypothetical protein
LAVGGFELACILASLYGLDGVAGAAVILLPVSRQRQIKDGTTAKKQRAGSVAARTYTAVLGCTK